MKKVYIVKNQDEALSVINKIFASGYKDSIILQDLIPGDDSNMRVLSAYSDKDKKVRMLCLGQVLLEEHAPTARGNHAAIITEYLPDITEKFRFMLDDLGYCGFSNFDIKFDPRDNSMRVFEINLRQGRSNYYITAAEINIARLIVEDYILDKTLEFTECKDEHFWSILPRGVLRKYIADKSIVSKVDSLYKSGRAKSSFWYKHDIMTNPLRLLFVIENMRRQYGKYKKYMNTENKD